MAKRACENCGVDIWRPGHTLCKQCWIEIELPKLKEKQANEAAVVSESTSCSKVFSDWVPEHVTNIFRLAQENGCKVLKVAKYNWEGSVAFVKKVKFSPTRSGLYGTAYGEIYYSNGNVVSGEIGGAGCYNWKLVEVLDEDMIVIE